MKVFSAYFIFLGFVCHCKSAESGQTKFIVSVFMHYLIPNVLFTCYISKIASENVFYLLSISWNIIC